MNKETINKLAERLLDVRSRLIGEGYSHDIGLRLNEIADDLARYIPDVPDDRIERMLKCLREFIRLRELLDTQPVVQEPVKCNLCGDLIVKAKVPKAPVVSPVVQECRHAIPSTAPHMVGCMDCGKAYESFPLDVVLSDEQWGLINPKVGGVLCACCIVERAAKLPTACVVRAVILNAEDVEVPAKHWAIAELDASHERIADLERQLAEEKERADRIADNNAALLENAAYADRQLAERDQQLAESHNDYCGDCVRRLESTLTAEREARQEAAGLLERARVVVCRDYCLTPAHVTICADARALTERTKP